MRRQFAATVVAVAVAVAVIFAVFDKRVSFKNMAASSLDQSRTN